MAIYSTMMTDDLVKALIKEMFDEYDADNVRRVLQSLFETYNQASRALGENDLSTGTRKR